MIVNIILVLQKLNIDFLTSVHKLKRVSTPFKSDFFFLSIIHPPVSAAAIAVFKLMEADAAAIVTFDHHNIRC